MHAILIQDQGYGSDINSVSKIATLREYLPYFTKIRIAYVNLKVEELGQKTREHSARVSS